MLYLGCSNHCVEAVQANILLTYSETLYIPLQDFDGGHSVGSQCIKPAQEDIVLGPQLISGRLLIGQDHLYHLYQGTFYYTASGLLV